MSDSCKLTETAEEATKRAVDSTRASRWVYVERGFSLAAIVGVVLLGGYAVQGMRNLFAENEAVITTEELEARQAQLPSPQSGLSALSAINRPGHWQMAGWQWELGVVTVLEKEVDQYLENVQPVDDMFVPEEREIAARLVDAMEYLPFQKTDRGNETVYQLAQEQLKLNVVTRLNDGVRLPVSIAAAAKVSDEAWSVFEMRAKQPVKQRRVASGGYSLADLPKDSQVLCSRTDQQGNVLFEIIQTETAISNLVDQFRNGGWEVQIVSYPNQLNQVYECANQGDVFHLWNVSSTKDQGNRIALMRVSNPDNQTSNQD